MVKLILITSLLLLLVLPLVFSSTTRTATTDEVCSIKGNQKTCTKAIYSGLMNYLENGLYTPIDSTIIPSSDASYDYEVTKGYYSTFFKADPTQGQVVKYIKDSVEITFQPMALNYRNDLSQIQQINMIQSVIGIPSDNYFVYEDAYGTNLDLRYIYYNDVLKEELVINNTTDLSSPAQYIIDGGNPTVDLDFIISTNSNHIVIDGFDWDKSTTTSTQTEVYIKDDNNNTVYYLPKPYAYDSNNSRSLLTYEFKKSGSSLYIILKTNYTWLNESNRVFPIDIDPTVKLSDTTSHIVSDISAFRGSSQYHSYVKANISSIPRNITISEILYCVYWNEGDALGALDDDAIIYRIDNRTWDESVSIADTNVLRNSRDNVTTTDWSSTTTGEEGCIDIYNQTIIDYNLTNNLTSFSLFDPDQGDSTYSFTPLNGNFQYYGNTEFGLKSNSRNNPSNTPYINYTFTYNIPSITLTTPINNSDILYRNRPFSFNFTINDSTYDIANASLWWNFSNVWQLNVTNTSRLTIGDETNTSLEANLSRGYFAWGIESCNVQGDCVFSINYTIQINNTLPTVASTSINDSTPLDGEDIECNNNTIADLDGDTVTLLYNWTKNGVDQSISTQIVDDSLTSDGETWVCKITPFDGFGNGSTITSASVSIGTGFVAPIINFTNSTPLTAELNKGEWINLSVNFTDSNSIDNHTAYFCKTDSADSSGCLGDNWCSSSSNVSSHNLSCRLDITDLSDFSLTTYDVYAFVVDNTTLISSSQKFTFTVQDITEPVISNISQKYTGMYTDQTQNITANITENVSTPLTVRLEIATSTSRTNYSMVNISTNLWAFAQTFGVGTYNITAIYATDNIGNSNRTNSSLAFSVTTRPSEDSGGGGGGGTFVLTEIINETEIITERICNNNNICEARLGEDFLNCKADCEFELGALNPICFINPQGEQCIYSFSIVARLLTLGMIISVIVIFFISEEDFNKIKKKFKNIKLPNRRYQ